MNIEDMVAGEYYNIGTKNHWNDTYIRVKFLETSKNSDGETYIKIVAHAIEHEFQQYVNVKNVTYVRKSCFGQVVTGGQ